MYNICIILYYNRVKIAQLFDRYLSQKYVYLHFLILRFSYAFSLLR